MNQSIESFCHQQGVSSEAFTKWFVTRKKCIVPVEIVGMPDDSTCKVCHPEESLSVAPPILEPAIRTVVISLSNGVEVSKSNLSYPDLFRLVEKLEVLC